MRFIFIQKQVVLMLALTATSAFAQFEVTFDAENGQTPASLGFVPWTSVTSGFAVPVGTGVNIPQLGDAVWQVNAIGLAGGYLLHLDGLMDPNDGFEITCYFRGLDTQPQDDCGIGNIAFNAPPRCGSGTPFGTNCYIFGAWYFLQMHSAPGSKVYTRSVSRIDHNSGEIIPGTTIENEDIPLLQAACNDPNFWTGFIARNNTTTFFSTQFDNFVFRSIKPTGPRVLLAAPSTPNEIVYDDESIAQLQFAFDEPVTAEPADVVITNQDGFIVPFSLEGSTTSLLKLNLGIALRDDTYTVVLADTIVGTVSGNALDGNNDGIAGGSYSHSVSHKSLCCDVNLDGFVTVSDIAPFVNCLVNMMPL